jgi:dTDP-4-amino-4,6-dideoxygalactose transaminase
VLKESNIKYRDKVRALLHDMGIQTSIHYPAVHKFSIYKEHRVLLPKTEYVSDNEITLPFYSGLSNEQIDYVCEKLNVIIHS